MGLVCIRLRSQVVWLILKVGCWVRRSKVNHREEPQNRTYLVEVINTVARVSAQTVYTGTNTELFRQR